MTESAGDRARLVDFIPGADRGRTAIFVGIAVLAMLPFAAALVRTLGLRILECDPSLTDPFVVCSGSGYSALVVVPVTIVLALITWIVGGLVYRRMAQLRTPESWGTFVRTAWIGLALAAAPLVFSLVRRPPLEAADWLPAIPIMVFTVIAVVLCLLAAHRPERSASRWWLLAGGVSAAAAVAFGPSFFVGQFWIMTVAAAGVLARTSPRTRRR